MPSEGTSTDTDTIRVLVVDDDAAIRRTYCDLLEDQGFPVAAANSGRQALQTLMHQSFDVLVVDVKMTEMDGIVLIQEALKIWPWLGVVIASAYVTEDMPERAARMGVTRILEKPIDVHTFIQAIRDEAADKQDLSTNIPHGKALTLMRDHLRLLANVSHRSVGTDTLADALREFGRSLTGMVPADVVGVLIQEAEEAPVLLVTAEEQVSPVFLSSLQTEMVNRFLALTGRPIDTNTLQVRASGVRADGDAPASIGNTLSVPLLLDDQICGLLSMASVRESQYTHMDISLLYHTANHISAVFTALRKMHGLATRDPLTSIFNRIRLEEELDRAWLTSRRYGYSMGVLVVDVDNFKTLNDAYGHRIGDEILRDFARILEAAARSTDIIARYGGDEFVAILPRAKDKDARAFGERLLLLTRDHVFCESSHRLPLTVSIGISTSDNPTAPATSSALLSQADRALYTAKRAGRNRICMWPGQDVGTPEAPASDQAPDKTEELFVRRGETNARIVLVEDEDPIRHLVEIMLHQDQHVVNSFASVNDAIAAIKADPHECDVLLTDIGLPDRSGIELMREVSAIDDSIVKVVMTGNATVDNAILCLREGAYDFIQKPVDSQSLQALIQRALEYRNLKIENARYQLHLEEMVRERSARLAASLEDVQASYEFTLDALVRMLDTREHLTGRHSRRVRELAVRLAQEMGLSAEEQETVAGGAFLHDIGKIGIPDDVLLKPGALNAEEWEQMQNHSQTGYNILRSSPYLTGAAEIVLQHHENFDGTGYPQHLKGDAIGMGARIFHVIDAYDAMRGQRIYRKRLSSADSTKEIERFGGTQFDPEVVAAFLRCRDDLDHILDTAEEG